MKNSLSWIAFVISIALGSFAQAGYYSNEFNSLVLALEQSRFKTEKLWSYEDPLVGKRQFILSTKRAPWAGNYFAMEDGGIANRWQNKSYPDLNRPFPSAQQLGSMPQSQINALSPAEKYDLYVGDYNFSVTKYELSHRGPFRSQPLEDWEGFCNGVRCAGFSLPEPRTAIEVQNPDGLTIRFEPSDLKALAGASYFYADKYTDMGRPSFGSEIRGAPPNPATFDLALRFYLGEKKKAFVIDTHLGAELWNESVVGFSRTISAPTQLTGDEQIKYPSAVHKIYIQTDLYTLGEIDIRKSNGLTKRQISEGHLHTVTPVGYTLYIDARGKAFDGEWDRASKDLRGVDFAWFASGRGMDSEYAPDSPEEWKRGVGDKNLKFSVINKLFKKARTQAPQCYSIF